jgi:diketogulonate reductase-like aldo/keto reductase
VEERGLGAVVGLGTWNTFGGNERAARAVVAAALDTGCRVFDSSPMYGGAERSLAAALAGRRERATVATKIWARSPAEGREQYRRQVGWFGRVEIEQVHNLVAWREHLAWLEDERGSGSVGLLGVTHYDRSSFEELARALRTRRFQVLQVPYNPHERECERRLLPLAADLGVAVIAMRPFGRGRLLARPPSAGDLAPLAEFGVRSWPQALLKWVLSERRIDVVIPATARPERARENSAAGARPWFGDEERRLIERLAG